MSTEDLVEFKIVLPVKALSLNNAYSTVPRGRRLMRVLSPKARKYKTEVSRLIKALFKRDKICLPDLEPYKYVDLEFEFIEKWHIKDMSKYRRRDISNLPKLVEDCLFDFLEIDDSRVRSMVLKKQCTQGTTRPDAIRIKVRMFKTDEVEDGTE